MTWHVWTDGSCQFGGVAQPPKRTRGWGGWAAIIEHGHDGYVLRGREPRTTNVRMELRAVVEGLAAVPEGELVVLHFDCTVVVSVARALELGRIDALAGADSQLWRECADELASHDVRLELLGRGRRADLHRRAHAIAGAEARAGLRDLPLNAEPISASALRRSHRKAAKRALAAETTPQEGVRRGMVRLRHLPACTVEFCLYGCPVWRHRHPGLHADPYRY